jgi:DNA-binding MarR family transcriptional regulator
VNTSTADATSSLASRFARGPAASPGFWLWRLTLSWQRAIAEALAPLGLTHVQFVLLACTWWMSERGQAPNQRQLADQAGTDIKMTSQVLRKLEAKQLIERPVDPTDTRARRLRPTPAGGALAEQAVAVVAQVDAVFFADGGDEFSTLLQRLVARADAAEADSR